MKRKLHALDVIQMLPRGWKFSFAARGYKENEDPGKSGSTRVVWHYARDDLYMVMKLFDDDGNFPEYPRTVKFWKTKQFAKDKMKWASAQNSFKPSQLEMDGYVRILDSLLGDIVSSLE